MAILHTRPRKFAGAGKLDNITYLMQHTKEGSKKLTPKQMQAIADEKDRQADLLGTGTRTIVWPEGKEFNAEDLDPTDAVVSYGDREVQEPFILKHFPRSSSAIVDWQYKKKEPGISRPMEKSGSIRNTKGEWEMQYTPGQWGVVDRTASQDVIDAARVGGNSATQVIANLLRHEVGHGWMKTGAGHVPEGIMQPGDTYMQDLLKGISINQLLSKDKNKFYRENIIKHRQYDINTGISDPKIDAYRKAKDNYDINRANRLEKERLAAITEFDRQQAYQDELKSKTTGFIPFTN